MQWGCEVDHIVCAIAVVEYTGFAWDNPGSNVPGGRCHAASNEITDR
jgi:hypothetical protein